MTPWNAGPKKEIILCIKRPHFLQFGIIVSNPFYDIFECEYAPVKCMRSLGYWYDVKNMCMFNNYIQ